MRCIVAGGRDYALEIADYQFLCTLKITELVSGGCRGADRNGEVWAHYWNIPVKRFPADWEKHGRAAGPIRNKEMAEYADAVVLFPGGRGTASMFSEAKRAGIIIYDKRTRE